ncbi:MAG: SLBB domain-containing protein [Pseudomonadota bacterium]
MIKKTMMFMVLCFFAFISTSFGGNISAQDLKALPPGLLEKLSPNEIEQLKQSMESQKTQMTQPVQGPVSSEQEKSASPLDKVVPAEKNRLAGQEVSTGMPDEKTSNEQKTVEQLSDKKDLTRPLHPDDLSIIEQQYRNSYASTLSSELLQFGYDIFNTAQLKTSNLAIPGSDYLLGTGDHLLIRLWGSGSDAEHSAVIDKQGRIDVPRIGMIQLAGVKFGDVESIIKKEAEKYIQGINLSVVLTSLRSLEVYIVGAVENPGLHVVPSFSTIFDGLLAANGVKKTGTLRNIKLFRNDKLNKVFDLYDLLLKGDRNSDSMLENRDVIFVPGIGHTAAVSGALNNEGIFEIKENTSVKNLVDMAGGMLPQAMDSRIDLRRFDKNKEFLVVDLNHKSVEQWNKIPVQNGDLIEFGYSKSMVYNVVKINGHVWDPDVFQFKPGMKLSDVLTTPEILKPDALTDFALIHRYDKLTTRTTPIRFPLSKVFSGEYDAPLQSFDTIVILSRSNIGIKENIVLTGAVWQPGQYEYKPGLTLKDALALAGGLKTEARTDKIEINRQIKTNTKFETEYIKLDLKQSADFILQAEDSILIPKLEDYTVKLEGHVWYPKILKYNSGMKLSEVLISRDLPKPEDLLKPDVVMDFGLIERYDAKTTRTTSVRFPLADVFSGKYDTELQPFDTIKILSRKDLGINETFSISGAVWNEGEFEFQPGLRLKDALALAGGLKFGARTQNIEIARQKIEQDRVQTEYILLDYTNDGNFLLNPYDAILIPKIKNATLINKVAITGEVAYPGTYTIREGETVSDLIARAGGFSEFAYFYGAKYTSEEARKIQQRSIDQMIEKLKVSITQASSKMAQTAVSEEDVQSAKATEDISKNLLTQLAMIKAEGRIAIKMADLASFKNSIYDFRLKHGDTLDIPTKPSFVSVVGSVYSPGSFLYESNKDLNFYLAKSGGIAKTADEDYMYLLKANGEILSMSQNNGFFSKFGSTVLMPGDTIVVPENLERFAYLNLIKDLADIAFKIATTAGVALSIAL